MIYLNNSTDIQQVYIPRQEIKKDAVSKYVSENELYDAIANETARTEETYQKIVEMSAYSTTNEVESMIDDAVSGKMDTSAMSAYSTTEQVENMITAATDGLASEEWVNDQGFLKEHQSLSAYTPTSGFSTINGSAITEGGDIVIETGGNYSAGTNIDITNDVISVTGITVPTKVSDLENDENFVNSGDVQSQIEDSISGKADYSAVTGQISDLKDEIEAEIPSKVSDLENDLNFASTGWVSEQGYLTNDSLSSYTPSSGFSTINGSAITSGGNIEIEGTPYSAGTNIQIEDHIISVTGITVPTKLSDLENDEHFINSGDAQTQIDNSISGKVDTSALTAYYTSAETNTAIENATSAFTTSADVKTQIEAYNYVNSGDVQSQINDSISGKVDTSAMTAYWTSAETESAITSATSGLQETLVSGTNIKTINNESILGSGNIVISGGSGSANIIELTQAEYDALTAYTEDAMYVITDAQEINMDNYATTGDIQTQISSALTPYYTSAQTDTAISNAVSGKTDKVSVTASSSGYKFPKWNDQGCITGTTATAYQASQSVNGSSRTLYSTSSSSLPSIYAPTTAGTAGQPLLSNGSGAPVWGSYKFQFLSQSAYDAITTKDSTTIYFIVDEN